MTVKHLSALLATSALALAATPVLGESSQSPDFNFACQNGNIPTTVAQTADGKVLGPVFHWKSEALPATADAEQLCNRVAAKLQDYSAQGYDLSSISFNSGEQAGLPAICASGETLGCDVVLFTLAPAEKPTEEADAVLSSVLDKSLQGQKRQSNDRGIMTTSYKVDFWSLFGFPKLVK